MGVCVRAAIRDSDNNQNVAHPKLLSQNGPGSIVFFKADLTETGSYSSATQGCTTIFYKASPFIIKFDDAKKD